MDLLKNTPAEQRPLSPIELDGADLRGVEVRREWEHIDLFIACQEPRFIIVIENKVGSKEGRNQLSRYEKKVKQHFPDERPLFVYLTPEADEPSEDDWVSYGYENIHNVLARDRKTHESAIGEDVLVFLDHYLNLIGTRFMNDPKIDELCQRIYKNHRQALDLIYDRAGSPAAGLLNEVESVLHKYQRWQVVQRTPKVIDFLPMAWVDWLPPWAVRSEPIAWIYARFHCFDDRLTYAVGMAPMKELEKRKAIAEKLIDKTSDFGFKRSRSREVKNNYSRLAAVETSKRWDVDNEPDTDEFREAVKKTLDKFFSRLDKMAAVLKPLVNELESLL